MAFRNSVPIITTELAKKSILEEAAQRARLMVCIPEHIKQILGTQAIVMRVPNQNKKQNAIYAIDIDTMQRTVK